MKKYFSLFTVLILFCSFGIKTDGGGKVPSINVKKLDGSTINTGTFSNNGKPYVISFWATWCKPCKKELDAIAENYEEWQKETGVKLVAISVDDARSVIKVPNDVKTKGWKYEVYTDENGDFQRAMNVNNVPHTFIIDGNGSIVYSHNSYADGDEDILYENIKKVLKGEKIEH
ncbi:MAG: TlpA family protein disulfide reductase [Bacteroidota bacterium]|jgi:cytochrome c biogenesis protein CcmG/thiol:disulfide interchange protein DsbE